MGPLEYTERLWGGGGRKKRTSAIHVHTHTQVIRTLGTETERYRSAAQCVAYIAATEIPQNLWPEVIPTLVANVTNMQATEALKESSLEALGYICEELVSGCCLLGNIAYYYTFWINLQLIV